MYLLSLAPSYNQPKFCLNINWNPNAITLENNVADSQLYGIYINTNNTVYATDSKNGQILIWFNQSINLTNTISNINDPFTVFVTNNSDIYVGDGSGTGQVNKWTFNTSTSILTMDVNSICYGLFVDISNTLYCSIPDYHQVVKKWLDDGMITSTIAAGSNSPGATPDKLNSPRGIFVSINFDLYVADCNNDRVQLFQLGQLNAITVAGNQVSQTITLSCPTGVVLDADNYLFIVDSGNHRIIGSGPTGFRCLVGCFGSGSAPNQLYYPQSMAFDSYGNIFVTDRNNSRIQKFVVATNSCSEYGSTKKTNEIFV